MGKAKTVTGKRALAGILGCHPHTVRKLVVQGVFNPTISIHGYVFDVEECKKAWAERQKYAEQFMKKKSERVHEQ